MLKNSVGRGYEVTYQALIDNGGFPREVALSTLEELTGAPSARIKQFIAGGPARAQAVVREQAAVHARAVAEEQAAAHARAIAEEQEAAQAVTAAQESYVFQLKCIAALSAVTCAIGIAVLLLATPGALGAGLTSVGAVGILTSGYGLFTCQSRMASEPVRAEQNLGLEGAGLAF